MPKKSSCGVLSIESCKRLVYLCLGLAICFAFLLAEFYKLQIIEGEKWSQKARRQHQLIVKEPCKRGSFYSNTGIKPGHAETAVPFVFDVPKFHLHADATVFSEEIRGSVVEALASFLELSSLGKKQMLEHLETTSRSRRLFSWMNQSTKETIEAWWFPFAKEHKLPKNGLFFVPDYKRSYPYGKMLGQILHTVREAKDPITQKQIPTGGLELMMNPYLQGKEGKRVMLRSPRNALDFGKVEEAPMDGADVFLTINHYIQAICEEEIAKAVIKANAKSGWAIMMQPETGEILAWAQYPWFEPEHYPDFFNNKELEKETKCKGITDPFEPGSIFKPITVLICLKANQELKKRGEPPLFSAEEKIAVSNGYFPGRSAPIHDVGTHRYLNMSMGLQKSSNIYVARLIQRVIEKMGDAWYRRCLEEDFGFGLKTGIELPSESSGLVPTPGKLHPNGTLEWSKPTPFSLAFGHNILVTSLQMVKAFAILANGGYDVQPTLIKKVVKTARDGKTEVLLDSEEKGLRKKVFDGGIVAELRTALQYTTKPGGCAAKGDIYGYTEIAKTGTSEKVINGVISRNDHVSSFIGWSPAKKPRFVLMIVMDEPEKKYIPGIGGNQFGGNCAAPAFALIGRRTLEYLGVPPDDPYGFPVGDPRRDPEKGFWVKESKALNALYQEWNRK